MTGKRIITIPALEVNILAGERVVIIEDIYIITNGKKDLDFLLWDKYGVMFKPLRSYCVPFVLGRENVNVC